LSNPTKLQNVAGVGSSSSQRATDMFMKVRYTQEQHKGGNVVFATGTPISNSISELYIMQKFLQPEELKKMGLIHFDAWASTFGEITFELESNPEGSGYRMRNRFAKFHNLPELMKTFRMVADIQTHDMLNLPTPEIEGGKAKIIVSQPSAYQERLMDELADRAEFIRDGYVDPQDDNMLVITNEAKLMAIDPRLLDEDAPICENSKLFQCANHVYDTWQETTEHNSTQLIFSDAGTPKPDKFNVYDEIKNQLIQKGVPEQEIAFIHDAKNDSQRQTLFEKVRAGEVRVLIGSTSKLGTGTNVQNKIIALHHIDCPWRPADIIQRDGRGVRQGNENEVIRLFRYVTKGTFDSYLWQIQEQKQRYISQVMTGKSMIRSCNDLDDTVLSAAEVKAIATSNPLLLEKMNFDNEINKLQLLKSSWANEKMEHQHNIEHRYPQLISAYEKELVKHQTELEILKANPIPKDENNLDMWKITLGDMTYDKRRDALVHLKQLMSTGAALNGETIQLGTYRGFELTGQVNKQKNDAYVSIGRYSVTYDAFVSTGIFTRISNQLTGLQHDFELKTFELRAFERDLEFAKVEVLKEFEHEERLAELLTKQHEINMKIELGVLEKERATDAETVVDADGEVSQLENNETQDISSFEIDDDNIKMNYQDLLPDDFVPPKGLIIIKTNEIGDDGVAKKLIRTWSKASETERYQWLLQEGYLSVDEQIANYQDVYFVPPQAHDMDAKEVDVLDEVAGTSEQIGGVMSNIQVQNVEYQGLEM